MGEPVRRDGGQIRGGERNREEREKERREEREMRDSVGERESGLPERGYREGRRGER